MADRQPDDHELAAMRRGLEEGLAAGAFGLSTGLIYPPAMFSQTAELTALAEVLAGQGRYTSHIRGEGTMLLTALTEALTVGAVAGQTHVSHLKAAGRDNWGRMGC